MTSSRVRLPMLALVAAGLASAASPLALRGYAVLPEPQQVNLKENDHRFPPAWRLEAAGLAADDVAVRTLREELASRYHVGAPGAAAGFTVSLKIAAGAVKPGKVTDADPASIVPQAYRITLGAQKIAIVANGAPGLFYGVETLAQLLRAEAGGLVFPEGEITDWPDLERRTLYWDDAHHLDKLPDLKRAVRTAAFYKINGFALKLEGHFQFKSAPAVVEPHAFTPAEYQELTDYGLRYHVQVIPFLDGPAHIAFILKHPEYAGLRSFADNNYEACATNPASYKLFEGMYQDLLDANKGVKYFYLSTDEPYYIGMASNSACEEKAEADKLGGRGKLLAQFLDKAAGYLHQHGRTVLFWGEYPLKPADIASLPGFLQNGEVYSREFNKAFTARGMRQNIYTSTQGEERIFPDYFQPQGAGRVEQIYQKISFDSSRKEALLKGAFVAAWADAGQHTENFWLGYAAGLAYAWKPATLTPAEATQAFFRSFYGPEALNMTRLYQLLSYQAQFWAKSWDDVPSTTRTGIWGNHLRQYTPRMPAEDQTIALPALPGEGLKYEAGWSTKYAERLKRASELLAENDQLLALIDENLYRVSRNRYNLEILRSNAQMCRENLLFLMGLANVEKTLAQASGEASRNIHEDAVESVDRALDQVIALRQLRNQTYHDAVASWYKSWFPRVAEANGRKYLHQLDDVKDHVPDRTVDMSYLVMRTRNLPLEDWYGKLEALRNEYGAKHGFAARKVALNWTSLD